MTLTVGDGTALSLQSPLERSPEAKKPPKALIPRSGSLCCICHARNNVAQYSSLDRLWGYAFDANLVEVYVGYLRRKLGEPPLIETLRGAGYVIREPAS